MQSRWTVLAAMVAAVAVAGCGGEKPAETGIEEAIEAGIEADGGEVDVDVSGDSVTIQGTDEDGQAFTMEISEETAQFSSEDGETSVVIGESAAMPEDWPADVPTYPGLTVQVATSTATDGSFMVSGHTADAVDTVAAYFEDAAAKSGWQRQAGMSPEGTPMRMLLFAKGNNSLTVMIMPEDDRTMVSITAMAE